MLSGIHAKLVECDLQEERLRSLFAKHHEDKGYLAILAEEMSGGFSRGQISSQLRKLGLKQGAASKHKAKKRKKEVLYQNQSTDCIKISWQLASHAVDCAYCWGEDGGPCFFVKAIWRKQVQQACGNTHAHTHTHTHLSRPHAMMQQSIQSVIAASHVVMSNVADTLGHG